ncbi:MAG: NUDIX hydrolase [Muribaculaceae bacterium]|nr:NUDIX hydrolase [Muribaculaceae bacterium]
MNRWKTLKSEYLIRRPWLTARRDAVQLPNGEINDEFYVLEYPDWINVIAITPNGDFVFVRQYRYALDLDSVELCAGVIEPGETPEEGARRELLEETGFGGGTWQEIMTIGQNPSTCNNWTHCFLATGVEKLQNQQLDRTEDIEVVLLSRDEVRQMLNSGQLKQALMLAPLWRYFATSTTNE